MQISRFLQISEVLTKVNSFFKTSQSCFKLIKKANTYINFLKNFDVQKLHIWKSSRVEVFG